MVTELQPGQQLDRYASERGTFLAPAGTPYTSRALVPGTDTLAPLNNYEVAKAITVKAGPATLVWRTGFGDSI
ncbi:TNT domain-containing protein [Paraburkholderia sp.]|uniref:TNT domain-containing protein n=1 Tax=Paraburkholderia sp. TaxID=1926495 RepID=UPI003D6E7992